MYRGRERGGRYSGGGGRDRQGSAGRGGGRYAYRGGGSGGGRGGGGMGDDIGFCVLHGRKRQRSEMIPLDGDPGRYRCDPNRECYQKQDAEEATCHLHNRQRKVTQMREVRAGVWECLPTFLCRQFGNGQMGVPVVAPAHQDRPRDSYGRAPARRGRFDRNDRNERYDRRGRQEQQQQLAEPVASPWAPNAAGGQAGQPPGAGGAGGADAGHGDAAGPRGAARAFGSRRGGYGAERKVWCARHGKHLYVSECEPVGDCCHMCTNDALCLVAPLEDSAELRHKDCRELLCARHNTLRSVVFLRLNDNKNGYNCAQGHACRWVTLPQMGLSAPALGDDAANGGGFAMQGEEDDGFATQEAYLGMNQGAATGGDMYVDHSGREAVSSFFV